MTFGGVKNPIANNFGELPEMDFSEYGDFAKSVRIRDTFRVSRLLFLWEPERKMGKRRKLLGV